MKMQKQNNTEKRFITEPQPRNSMKMQEKKRKKSNDVVRPAPSSKFLQNGSRSKKFGGTRCVGTKPSVVFQKPNQRGFQTHCIHRVNPRTVPGVEHVGDEVVHEADLRLGNGARGAVELRHHHRQTARLLLGRLQSIQPLTVTQSYFHLVLDRYQSHVRRFTLSSPVNSFTDGWRTVCS